VILSKRKENKNGGKYKGRRKIYSVKKERSCAKEIFESTKGCKHPLIASGATSIGSAGRAPNKIKARRKAKKKRRPYI
jgi:hypothetical protein